MITQPKKKKRKAIISPKTFRIYTKNTAQESPTDKYSIINHRENTRTEKGRKKKKKKKKRHAAVSKTSPRPKPENHLHKLQSVCHMFIKHKPLFV